jgi:hypothetical protein
MKKYINYLDVDLGVNQIGEFKMCRDFHTNAIYWTNGVIKIFASPEFEEIGIVSVQIEYYDDNFKLHLSDGEFFYLNNEFNLDAQIERYLEIIEAIIRQVDCMEFYTHYYQNMNSVLDNNFWKQFN